MFGGKKNRQNCHVEGGGEDKSNKKKALKDLLVLVPGWLGLGKGTEKAVDAKRWKKKKRDVQGGMTAKKKTKSGVLLVSTVILGCGEKKKSLVHGFKQEKERKKGTQRGEQGGRQQNELDCVQQVSRKGPMEDLNAEQRNHKGKRAGAGYHAEKERPGANFK